MLIRERLALWYGTLCGMMLVLLSIFTYGLYVRSQYQDVEALLVVTGNHVTAGLLAANRSNVLRAENNGVTIRLFHEDGTLRETSPKSSSLPILSPRDTLLQLSRPVLPRWVRSLPALDAPFQIPAGSRFGVLWHQGKRWRTYTTKIQRPSGTVGYLQTLVSLSHMDRSTARLRLLLVTLAGVFTVLSGLLALMVAGRALSPLARLTRTAEDISHSHDLSQRVEQFPIRDELGMLAHTLNQMLASLSEAESVHRLFFADASHELRTPIAILRGNLELLRRYPTMTPGQREEIVHDAELEAGRLGRLVEDLLTLAKKDAHLALLEEPVNYSEVAVQAFRDAQQLKDQQQMQLDVQANCWVLGDEDRLKQLLLIVLDNALRYTPGEGKVMLQVNQQGGQVVTTLRDTGMGISEEDRHRIFDRFYRGEDARSCNPSGSGLGLAIARWLVGAHHGHLELQSTLGEGTHVCITLPSQTV